MRGKEFHRSTDLLLSTPRLPKALIPELLVYRILDYFLRGQVTLMVSGESSKRGGSSTSGSPDLQTRISVETTTDQYTYTQIKDLRHKSLISIRVLLLRGWKVTRTWYTSRDTILVPHGRKCLGLVRYATHNRSECILFYLRVSSCH